MQRRILILTFLLSFLISCAPTLVEDEKHVNTVFSAKDSLMQYNQKFVEYEAQLIEDYIRRHHLRMETSGTGLRFRIISPGKGNTIRLGQAVALTYRMYLLTGDLIDEVTKDNPLKFTVGKGMVIPGLEEIALKLGVGGNAKIIVPSHLAYGAAGVVGEIPPRATLVFELEIIDVK